MTLSHYLNRCWNIVKWNLGNKLHWNFNRNWNISIQENAFENIVCEMASICPGLNVITHLPLDKMAAILADDISKCIFVNENDKFHFKFCLNLFPGVQLTTRTTRTPAFWDTPRRPMITHTIDSHQIPSQSNTTSKLRIKKNCQNFKFWKFATNFARDTPSEVAW